jgi:hypothetical protein
MSGKVISILRQRRDELAGLDSQRSNWAKITEWHARTRPLVAEYFSDQLDQFDEFIKPQWAAFPRVISLGPGRSNNSRVDEAEGRANDNIAKNSKEKLLAHLDALIELRSLDDDPPSGDAGADLRRITLNQTANVFVVHGHDEEMKQNAARTLSKLGLNPIILHEQPNAGKTILEKFEVNADVSFALVLLSPDDMAFPAGGDAKHASSRARQNVVLELGYFVGRLGRNRVFPLKRGDNLELPSDFSGVIYTPYDAAGHWRFELVRELKAAGYGVDANALL